MTGINPAGASLFAGVQGSPMASSNPRLKALEQKLDRLKKEKEEAARGNDRDKKKELENEIRKVEQQIEQLKKKERQKQQRQQKQQRDEEMPQSTRS